MNYPRVIIAAANSSSGKTTITLGIILGLRKKGFNVQSFKSGPDYIDPSYHSYGSNNICRNLDSWLISKKNILELFQRQARNADISVIEGAMGLYDGLKDTEYGSTAHLSKILNCPVILILNASSLSRSAAAIVLGYQKFDRNVNIKGVILNNIGSDKHFEYIKNVIELKVGIPVLGYLPKSPDLKLPERHLGLIPEKERELKSKFVNKLMSLVEQNIDLNKIAKIAKQAPRLVDVKPYIFGGKIHKDQVTIAVAKDKAFNFYYRDNLDILSNLGARLVEFSPLKDKKLPKCIHGLYIGGGFPELFGEQLSKNISLRQDIFQQATNCLPIYAECGGLMYLVDKLINSERKEFSMVGIFKCSVKMANKRQALGYVQIETIKDNILSKKGDTNRAHIFHWSYIDDISKNTSFAYRIKKDSDKILYDGLIKKNVLASYAHIHFASNIAFAKNFVNSCKTLMTTNLGRITANNISGN